MKDYIVMVQDLLAGRNEEFDTADRKRVRLIRHKDSRKEKNIGGKIYGKSMEKPPKFGRLTQYNL